MIIKSLQLFLEKSEYFQFHFRLSSNLKSVQSEPVSNIRCKTREILWTGGGKKRAASAKRTNVRNIPGKTGQMMKAASGKYRHASHISLIPLTLHLKCDAVTEHQGAQEINVLIHHNLRNWAPGNGSFRGLCNIVVNPKGDPLRSPDIFRI